jgi:hypothetical protein
VADCPPVEAVVPTGADPPAEDPVAGTRSKPAEAEPVAEAALAVEALRPAEATAREPPGARACSGPNSRLALAAGTRAADTPARVEEEPRADAVAPGTVWAPAIDELRRAYLAPGPPASLARAT